MKKFTALITGAGVLFLGLSIYSLILAYRQNSFNCFTLSIVSILTFAICLTYLFFSAYNYIDDFEKKIFIGRNGISDFNFWQALPFRAKLSEISGFRKFKKIILKNDPNKIFGSKHLAEQFRIYLEFKEFQYINIRRGEQAINYGDLNIFTKHSIDFVNFYEFVHLIRTKYEEAGIMSNITTAAETSLMASSVLNPTGNFLSDPAAVTECFQTPNILQIEGVDQFHTVPKTFIDLIYKDKEENIHHYKQFRDRAAVQIRTSGETYSCDKVFVTRKLVNWYENILVNYLAINDEASCFFAKS